MRKENYWALGKCVDKLFKLQLLGVCGGHISTLERIEQTTRSKHHVLNWGKGEKRPSENISRRFFGQSYHQTRQRLFKTICILFSTQKIGCKPYWIKLDSNLETCKELKNIGNYLLKLRESIGMDEQTIYEAYNCLKPCTYIEYKVGGQIDVAF